MSNLDDLKQLSLQELREKYTRFLKARGLSSGTIGTSRSSAFYLWQDLGYEAFWKAVEEKDDKIVKALFLEILEKKSSPNVERDANGYMYHLRKFRLFVFGNKGAETSNIPKEDPGRTAPTPNSLKSQEVDANKEIVVSLVRDVMKKVERISKELGDEITPNDYYIEDLGCPHLPPKRLPAGYSAVYFFVNETTCDNESKYDFLKIGKVNELSNARFTSQHYGFNAKSTLAKSLCNDPEFTSMGIKSDNAKDWITGNLRRVNVLIKAEKGKAATELIEAVMHYAFRPKYEGAL